MSAVTRLNPNAQSNVGNQAINISISAAKGLQDVLKSNLGPKGTMKLLVGGSGDLKMTKDGNVLLHEMQIQHPTAALIARTATSQDDITGDGTTSNVLLIAELLKQSERFLQEGLHPRIITDGFELAKVRALEFLEKFRIEKDTLNRELLVNVARTSLRTKVYEQLADSLTEVVTDAILTIRRGDEPVDLFMVEIMTMQHQSDRDTKLIKGLVLDHGARHPDMPKRLENCFVLICNVSFEYEKSEINTNMMYRSAEEKAKVVDSERKWVEDRVKKVIELKKKVCDTPDKNFVVINQKGIDPGALEMFAHAGIIALRRAKRRNMERLTLACGGLQVNSVDEDLNESVLGYAGLVYEHVLGEDKYTFVEGVTNPFSVSILVKGSNKHTIAQIQDAVRDGLRAVKNAIEDKAVVPGAGAFQIAAHADLMKYKQEVSGRTKLGVQAFADALLIIPKVLASNSGFDPIDAIVTLQEEYAKGHVVGLDLATGDCLSPSEEGIWDNYRVVRQLLNSCSVIATQLLLVDEIMRAGKNFGKTG